MSRAWVEKMGRLGARVVWVMVASCAVGWLVVGQVVAQPLTPSERREKEAQNERWVKAYLERRWDEAEAALKAILEGWPGEFVAWYNLACVYAQSGRGREAEAALERAVISGFVDFHRMEQDPGLAPIRSSGTYRAMIQGWRAVLDAHGEAAERAARERLGSGYIFERDERRRLIFAGGFAEVSFRRAQRSMDLVEAWWRRHVLPPVDRDADDPDRPDPWVMVVLPTAADYRAWSDRNFGPQASRLNTIGGVYDHDRKELVAMDLGPTLRHEYLHVLHWRHMARTGVIQPLWVQEGLCSLLEAVERDGEGGLRVVSSWRMNTVKRLQSTGLLPSWRGFFARDADEFTRSKPLANYAVAYAIMRWLEEQGKLGEWYTAYVQGVGEDPTGARAMEAVTGVDLATAERRWREWVRAHPDVPDQHRPGRAVLPLDLEPAGEGLRVTELPRGEAARSGIRLGDVIMEVEGREVCDLNELALALAGRGVGEPVRVEYRRGRLTGEVTLVLRAAE